MIKHKQSGISLIEVVVTMFIMSVGLLGLAGLQSSAVKDGLSVAQRSQVTWIVSELVERMRANSEDLNGYAVIPANVLDCSGAPARRCADNLMGNAQACTAAEMAEYDAWDIFCGQGDPADNTVITNAQDSLTLNALSITCSDAVCDNNSDYTVSINWNSKVTSNSRILRKQGTEAAQTNQSISMTVRP